MDEVCGYMSSKPADEWTDLGEIGGLFVGYGLTEEKVEMALNFLKKYCFELDETGRKARLTRCFHNFYRKAEREDPVLF